MIKRDCISCGKGTIKPLSKVGRKYKYKGVVITIPVEIEVPTCDFCGAEWFDSKVAETIDKALEDEYQKILKG